jgi:hypothetical protein
MVWRAGIDSGGTGATNALIQRRRHNRRRWSRTPLRSLVSTRSPDELAVHAMAGLAVEDVKGDAFGVEAV